MSTREAFRDYGNVYNHPLHKDGEPPDNGGMETRIIKLEEAVAALPTKADFAQLRADIADTRTDVHKAIADNHRWTHGALLAILSVGVIGILGLLFTIYNATKSAPALSSQAPATIILQVPSTPPLQTPAAVYPVPEQSSQPSAPQK